MLKFEKPLKIYLFKDRDTVDLSIRVSDNYVHTWQLPAAAVELMIQHWRNESGWSWNGPEHHWFVQHKRSTPRPESAPASYVRISVSVGHTYNYRVDYQDMLDLEHDFRFQQNNPMYWD